MLLQREVHVGVVEAVDVGLDDERLRHRGREGHLVGEGGGGGGAAQWGRGRGFPCVWCGVVGPDVEVGVDYADHFLHSLGLRAGFVLGANILICFFAISTLVAFFFFFLIRMKQNK